ncbi:hypothetical protein O181_048353 [Austropuccinia psidii MF-1]|uniref:Uncharacterized protein n=1 Tax=Austropuccinia psidii MF-1 TaxID=1389203 RepID=A0A9Q3DVN5_9BASI|nr:hypothetical protein [Austropuccinia psidii MF-1]
MLIRSIQRWHNTNGTTHNGQICFISMCKYFLKNQPYSQFPKQCQPPAIPQCVYACVRTAYLKFTLPLRVISREFPSHIKKLKSDIEPKSIPNIATSESGSECLQIPTHQIFPTDYSQFTQSPFSTPPGLNSTSQKPYSVSQNLPPQDLGMIISAILSLRYNIPWRASQTLNPTLNLLIKSSISSFCGHPTPAFHIPQYLSTIFGNLQLGALI